MLKFLFNELGECENNQYYGSNCEKTYCNGISSTNKTAVCSGHGECFELNNCTCGKNKS
jgi:hypothetical protein